jgi:hypothetical protein
VTFEFLRANLFFEIDIFAPTEVVALQATLVILNNDLNVAADTFQKVSQFFRSQKSDLDKFKAECTTPYFCGRIDGDLFLSKADPQKVGVTFALVQLRIASHADSLHTAVNPRKSQCLAGCGG